MNNINLNLARKWRSKQFDQIIGQKLPVRILKNSLYLDQYFPVYLFSGQRGCGKTTTARVFAAAINCEQLLQFQKQPTKQIIPCLTCTSCKAMQLGKHPDFVEIDAASHTGVDNVRQIIELASLLPIMGRRKIYLIDEAHMLSKAAFNAFLKVLEEPPSSVLFILATTSQKKIIDTVRSRCFQLFFKPVARDVLLSHLKQICKAEGINHETHGLELIIKESQGSVRDALNILEQVRFACSCVDKKAVTQVLGHIDDEQMLQLFALLLGKEPQQILQFLQTIQFSSCSAEFVWNKLIELIRASLWLKYNVEPDWFVGQSNQLSTLTKRCSSGQLNSMLKRMHANEGIFLKTTAKHSLLEMILLQICQKNSSGSSGASSAPQSVAAPTYELSMEEDESDLDQEEDNDEQEDDSLWQQFLTKLDELNDPLLSSIFKNGRFVQFKQKTGVLEITFSKEFVFFKESLDVAVATWLPVLQQIFSDNVVFTPHFTNEHKPIAKTTSSISSLASPQASRRPYHTAKKINLGAQDKQIDMSDTIKWKKANMLLQSFPGRLSEIKGGN